LTGNGDNRGFTGKIGHRELKSGNPRRTAWHFLPRGK
jgi:hypothetical protein